DASGPSIEAQNKLVAQYCSGCHSERGKAGGLVLAGFDAAKVEANAETAEKMIRKLRAGMMPPPAARHPDAAAVRALVDSFESLIGKSAGVNHKPWWTPLP